MSDLRRSAVAFGVAGALALTGACSSSPHTGSGQHRGNVSSASPTPPSGTPSAPASPSPKLTAFYRQRLQWSGCNEGFQCAQLRVPLDYRHPHGRRLSIAVVRLPASDPRHRIGSLVVNPGGPGGSGVGYARAARLIFPSDILARFDIVGFDPRGVGQSAPVKCFSDHQLDQVLHVDADPTTQAKLNTLIATAKRWARACEQHNGKALLAHIDTRDAARDMDVLRAALHDRTLTYIGESYGTYLGAQYADLFPTHIRALVLDGAADPTVSSLQADIVQAKGFETDLTDFINDCIKRTDCPLGRSVKSARQTLANLHQTAVSHGFPTADHRVVGDSEWFGGLASALYSVSQWEDLRNALAAAKNGDGSSIMRLNDELVERDSNGHYANLQEAFVAITCVDRPAPRTVSAYAAAAQQGAQVSPNFGAINVWSSLPCAYWPVPPVQGLRPVHADGAPPIVVIGTTHDPATPYVWAQSLASQLSSGVLLTHDGDGHTAYNSSSCIDTVVDRYLITRHPPARGTVCH